MRSIHVYGGTLALCLAANTALAANVQLGDAGDGPAVAGGAPRKCIANGDRVVPGQSFPITIRGQSRSSQNQQGTIRIDELTHSPSRYFDFAPPQSHALPAPSPAHSTLIPTFLFTPIMDKLSCSYGASEQLKTPVIKVSYAAGEGNYWLYFVAKDALGAEDTFNHPSCSVSVVRTLPDVEALSLGYDAPVSGRSALTIRLTIRNASPSAAPPVDVPWSISLAKRRQGLGSIYDTFRIIASGVVHNVDSGTTVEVAAQNPAVRGTDYAIIGQVDPGRTLGENSGQLGNNSLQMRWKAEWPDVAAISLGYEAPSGGSNAPTIRLKMRNNAHAPLSSVPWSITIARRRLPSRNDYDSYAVLASGVKSSVQPDATFEATAQDLGSPVSGEEWIVIGEVDSQHTIREHPVQWENNRIQISRQFPDKPCPSGCSRSGAMCLKNLPSDSPEWIQIGPIWILVPPARVFQCNRTDDCADGYACDGKYCRAICSQ